ncbi:MAG TPA: HEAT repeat domain-containing protein [Pirellulales bacterium]|nr:HEAT repeat domain-containing protein [Pirellulales bacterium]
MARVALRIAPAVVIAILASVAIADEKAAKSETAKPAFDELIVKFDPSFLSSFGQREQLQVAANGRCVYRAEPREPRPNVPARSGGVLEHALSADRVERLNRLLKDTKWLTAAGGEGPATHTDAWTTTLTLRREGKTTLIACHGERPEPYASLLRELSGLALQERRVYLHDYVSGAEGTQAWREIGDELAALRGDPRSTSSLPIDYERYLPIAKRVIHGFYNNSDAELIPAVRLVGQLKTRSELPFLHRMANDRSADLRREVAWALGRIHDRESLPVLGDMMLASGTRWDVGFELIKWGDDAVPQIVDLIGLSTKDTKDYEQNTIGEDMIRAYLEHWSKLAQPVDPRVVVAVKKSLENANPEKSIRTTYHREFLKAVERQANAAQ